MKKKDERNILNDIKYKNLTVFRFTFLQLMYSKMNIGIVVLILIPLLISGLFASGALKDEREFTEYEGLVEGGFAAEDDDFFFAGESEDNNIELTLNQFVYDYDNNEFTVDLDGRSSESVDYIMINITYYFSLTDWEDILEDVGDIFGGADNFIRDGEDEFTSNKSKAVTIWDYSFDDRFNWTTCTNKFIAYGDGQVQPLDFQPFNIKIGEVNVLPYSIDGDFGIFQFGLINFSASREGQDWVWSNWHLRLSFGGLDYLMSDFIGAGLPDIFDSGILSDLESSRLYWPDQVIIFIDGYNATGENHTRNGQAVYSKTINKAINRDVTIEEIPGYQVFLSAGGRLFFSFLIPVISLLYISVAIADDLEKRTLTYFLSRPISKTNLFMSKYFSAYTAQLVMIVPSMVLTYFIMSGYKDGMETAMDNIGILKVFLGMTFLGLLVYSAVFMLFASILRHPLIIGLIYIFFFDQLISNLGYSINRVGINYYLNSIAFSSLKGYGLVEVFKPIDTQSAVLILMIATVIMWIVANLFYTDKDFH